MRNLLNVTKDLYKIHCAFENHKQVEHYETFKVLAKVFTQQWEEYGDIPFFLPESRKQTSTRSGYYLKRECLKFWMFG